MDVGPRIKEYLRSNGISQTYLSSRTNIPPAKLNLALNAKRKLTLAEYESICIALGVSLGTFLRSSAPEATAS